MRLNVMAQPIKIDIPHALGKDEARRRIASGFDRLRQQMTGGLIAIGQFHDRWEDDRLHFEGTALGQRITGRIDVNDNSVQMQFDLPEFVAAIASRIHSKLQEEGRKLLEKR
jgi:hypothetical protein